MILPGLPFGLSGIAPPKFVGGRGFFATPSNSVTVPLTSLSGGLAASPQAGDTVVVAVTDLDDNETITATTSGYTKIAEVQSSSVPNLAVFAKRLTTPETSFSASRLGSDGWAAVVHVWRNMNATQILDATSTVSSSDSVGSPNPPSITTVRGNAVVLAVGLVADPQGISGPPSQMANFVKDPSFGAIAMASIIRPSVGAYDPEVFPVFSQNSWSAATIALRPK